MGCDIVRVQAEAFSPHTWDTPFIMLARPSPPPHARRRQKHRSSYSALRKLVCLFRTTSDTRIFLASAADAWCCTNYASHRRYHLYSRGALISRALLNGTRGRVGQQVGGLIIGIIEIALPGCPGGCEEKISLFGLRLI